MTLRSRFCGWVADGGVNVRLFIVFGCMVLGGGCGGVAQRRGEALLMERVR